jgi:hypothetical protein
LLFRRFKIIGLEQPHAISEELFGLFEIKLRCLFHKRCEMINDVTRS